jgi:hypothetical protein
MALAWALALNGDTKSAAASADQAWKHLAHSSRQDRQHIEILTALLHGRLSQALDLAFEHLSEFGSDPLLTHLLDRCICDRDDPGLTAGLHALHERDSA